MKKETQKLISNNNRLILYFSEIDFPFFFFCLFEQNPFCIIIIFLHTRQFSDRFNAISKMQVVIRTSKKKPFQIRKSDPTFQNVQHMYF